MGRDASWRAETAWVLRAVRMRTWRAGIVRRVTVWRIRRNGRCIRVRDALRLAEQRQGDERSKNCALQNDGNRERASTDAALPTALSGIAFDKTSAQRTKSFFCHIFSNVFRFQRHTPPPQNSLRVLTRTESWSLCTSF